MIYNLDLTFIQARREILKENNLEEITYWGLDAEGNAVDNDSVVTELESTILGAFSDKELLIKHPKFQKWKIRKKNSSQEVESRFELIIAFVDNNALNDPEVFARLINDSRLRITTDPMTRKFDEAADFHPIPILFVGEENLMEVKDIYQNISDEERITQEELVNKFHQRIDSRFRVLDSSIWNRFISHSPPSSFVQRLEKILKTIITYHQFGLYQSIVGHEYLEFQCRKFRESYVKNYPGGHAKKVTPFRFHSESRMKELADNLLIQLEPYSWTCLLVDDYAYKPLRSISNGQPNLSQNKRTWIQYLANTEANKRILTLVDPKNIVKKDLPESSGFIKYYLDFLLTRKGKDKPRPDVIILDYFFGIGETDSKQQYGHKFIKNLNAKGELTEAYSITPETQAFGKYWIFPISAFEHAFWSHLRLMGHTPGRDFIEFSDGADPINSPELFRYLFYSFLLHQKQKVGLNKSILTNMVKEILEMQENKLLNSNLHHYKEEIEGVDIRILRLIRERTRSEFGLTYLPTDRIIKLVFETLTYLSKLLAFIPFKKDSGKSLEEFKEKYLALKGLKQQLKERINKNEGISGNHSLAEDLVPQSFLDIVSEYIDSL